MAQFDLWGTKLPLFLKLISEITRFYKKVNYKGFLC